MDPRDELIDLENEGWRALSAGGAEATEFYGRVLDDERRDAAARRHAPRPTATRSWSR